MKRKKPMWRHDAPLPKFKSHAAEVAFWESHEFADDSPDAWEKVERVRDFAEVLRFEGPRPKADIVVYLPKGDKQLIEGKSTESIPMLVQLPRAAATRLQRVAAKRRSSPAKVLRGIVEDAVRNAVKDRGSRRAAR